MAPLTNHQHKILKALLSSDGAVAAAQLGELAGLTARQVRYHLQGTRDWLKRRQVQLKTRQGVGYVLDYADPGDRQRLMDELRARQDYELILSAGQRQHLLALELLLVEEPRIIFQLQRAVRVSRTTILKDLDTLERWFARFHLELDRRQNYGCQLIGPELMRQQALLCLLWGASGLDDPLLRASHEQGIVFSLAEEVALLPIVKRVHDFVQQCDTERARQVAAAAEARLDAHFTDEAFLLLSLALAVQAQRVSAGRLVNQDDTLLDWIEEQPTWSVAVGLAGRLWHERVEALPIGEITLLALQLMAADRDDQHARTLADGAGFDELLAILRSHIAAAYQAPALAQDNALHNALAAHVMPAVLRERYHLWAPTVVHEEIRAPRYAFERMVAQQLATTVAAHTGVVLPEAELSNLVLLLRAAFIRERPAHVQHILVICPAGMATSQLLLARLQARFPRLGTFESLSIRDLTEDKIASAALILSTVPLSLPDDNDIDVLVVHPLLAEKDVEAIFRWLR